jgi:N-methylhydantoinase B
MTIDGQPIAVRRAHRVEPGQTVTVSIPGGGGFGDPRERPAELIAADIDAGAITSDIYGHAADR